MQPLKPLRRLLGRGLRGTHRLLLATQRRQQKYVLILGHMRSGSTLLAHLLMNHPHILGGGERNKVLRHEGDLFDLCLDLYREHRLGARRFSYVLDQINHTRFTPDPELLNHPRVRVLFLLRRPGPATASMVRTFQPIYGDWPLERAIDTYEQRLQSLIGYAEHMTRPWFFTTYEDLVAEPEKGLARLTRFLALDQPLTAEYRTWSFTGKRGDPSAKIASGAILPPRAEEHLLDEEDQRRLERVFDDTCRLLRRP